jgi:hypothetical protein
MPRQAPEADGFRPRAYDACVRFHIVGAHAEK